MDDIVKKFLYYDFYGELLTPHQKEVYGDYIADDLSLTELAAIKGISRQAAYDMVRRCEKLLRGYEERLHLAEQFLKVKKIVSDIRQTAGEIEEAGPGIGQEKLRSSVEEIISLSDAILEEY